MSQVREDLIRKLVRELVKQELEEANSTASVGGSYNTPHAFGGSNKKGKGKGKAGYTGGHTEPTDGTGHFIADDPKLRKESINEAVKKLSVHFPKRTVKRMPEVEKFVKKFVPKAKFERKGNVLHIDGRGKSLKRLSQYIYNEFLVDKVMWESVSVVNEGRYHAWRNDDTLTPKQKIGMAMRETRDNLTELERVVRYNVRLKNELKVDSRDYWKNTHKALSKISERLVKLANKVGQLL